MKFEFELQRQINLYIDYLRDEHGDLAANIAEAILKSFLNWYEVD